MSTKFQFLFFLLCATTIIINLDYISTNMLYPNKWKLMADARLHKFSKKITYRYSKPPKNVILFIGDGMSLSTVTAGRYMKAQMQNKSAGEVFLSWDDWPTASLVRTFNLDRLTTDSSSSATAFLGGAKGKQKTVGITGTSECCVCNSIEDAEKVKSILIQASEAGLSTGIVTTTRITHATPGSGYAHCRHRIWEANVPNPELCKDIALQLIENGININVLYGGGLRHFSGKETMGIRKDKRNLIKEWEDKQESLGRRYKFIKTKEELETLETEEVDYVLGLFAGSHLQYYLRDAKNEPRLMEMVESAVKILSRNKKGYLLLVEGGRIDHAHHENKAHLALGELDELDKTVELCQKKVELSETLLIVTSDHSHSYGIVGNGYRNQSVLSISPFLTGLDKKAYTQSLYLTGPGGAANRTRSDPIKDNIFDIDYKQQALVPLHSAEHSAEDVSIYAEGPFNDIFQGALDNTYIAYATLFSLCLPDYAMYPHCQKKFSYYY